MNFNEIAVRGRMFNEAEYDAAYAVLSGMLEQAGDERERLQRIAWGGSTKKPSRRVLAARADLDNVRAWIAAIGERLLKMIGPLR
jgi:hypothetical protein